jgi:hypothetical protein
MPTCRAWQKFFFKLFNIRQQLVASRRSVGAKDWGERLGLPNLSVAAVKPSRSNLHLREVSNGLGEN